MPIKFLILSLVLILFTFSLQAFDPEIPQELKDMGFNESNLVDYQKLDDTEVFTFKDWTSEIKNDTVSFMVKRGKVIRVIEELGE
ncbi:MAG: hypothetical protein JW867_03940 [Candidatus Omnitrophica bacterium]|nr:hypothetical protein [Candidatus Omnitrophota bacterium]